MGLPWAEVKWPIHRTNLAVNGCQGQRGRTPADEIELGWRSVDTPHSFEDRGVAIHARPERSAVVRPRACTFQDRPPLSAAVRPVGCLLGCQRHVRGILNPKVQGSTPCASTIMWPCSQKVC